MQRTLCIIPCGSKKIWERIPNATNVQAQHVYQGSFHKKCKEYAQAFYPDSWCILSAKYGFLFPDDIVPESYNVTFNDRLTNPISIGDLVIQKIGKHIDSYDTIVCLGGKNYTEIIEKVFHNKQVIVPLKGYRGMGYMLQAMTNAISSHKPLYP